jgi:hypothetical protein
MRAMKGFIVAALAASVIALAATPAQAGHDGALTIFDLTTGAAKKSSLITVKFEDDFASSFGYGALDKASVVVTLTFESGDTRKLTVTGPVEDAGLTSSVSDDPTLAARDGRALLIEAAGFPEPLKRIDVETFAAPGDGVDHVIRKPVAQLDCTALLNQFHTTNVDGRHAHAGAHRLKRKQGKIAKKLADAESAGDTDRAHELRPRLAEVTYEFELTRDQAVLWGKREADLRLPVRPCF